MSAPFDQYAIQHASLRARLLGVTAGFPPDAIDDAQQDLLLDYLRRAPKYDGARGDHDGFVRGVMRNHATVLIARRARTVRHEVLADDLTERESENPKAAAIIHYGDPTIAFEVSLEVRRVLRHLPRQLQNLAALLPDFPVAEVCITIGTSRSRTYRMIREIRTAFSAAGLEPRCVLSSRASAKCRPKAEDPSRVLDGGR